jgi:hypothetical protein
MVWPGKLDQEYRQLLVESGRVTTEKGGRKGAGKGGKMGKGGDMGGKAGNMRGSDSRFGPLPSNVTKRLNQKDGGNPKI